MAKAAIIAVDDEPVVLNAVERDLRQKYGRDYRILKVDSGAAGLDVVRQLHARDEEIALFVSDQRMPDMSGVQSFRWRARSFPTRNGCS
jgi:thioredoxin reductase (NADPH)